MQYIYSRVSTDKQDTENQLARLRASYPGAHIVEETASGAKARPALAALLEQIQPGDELIIASLDRLGRRTTEILTLIERLYARGVILKSLREGVDYSTPAGKLVVQVMCAVAELERNLISERTKAALDAKRRLGIVGGRPSTFSDDTRAKVIALRAQGMPVREVAKQTGVSSSRVSQMARKGGGKS